MTLIAISTATIDELLTIAPETNIKRGGIIEPGRLYRVCSGRVRIHRPLDNGKRVGFGFYGPEDFFGFSWTGEVATAKTDTAVMGWAPERIAEMISRRPDLGLALLKAATAESQRLAQRIAGMTESAEKRIARLFLDMAADHPAIQSSLTFGVAPMTHEEIADEVLTTREMVTHHMNDFRRRGAISYDRRGIWVRPDALRALVGLAPCRQLEEVA